MYLFENVRTLDVLLFTCFTVFLNHTTYYFLPTSRVLLFTHIKGVTVYQQRTSEVLLFTHIGGVVTVYPHRRCCYCLPTSEVLLFTHSGGVVTVYPHRRCYCLFTAEVLLLFFSSLHRWRRRRHRSTSLCRRLTESLRDDRRKGIGPSLRGAGRVVLFQPTCGHGDTRRWS